MGCLCLAFSKPQLPYLYYGAVAAATAQQMTECVCIQHSPDPRWCGLVAKSCLTAATPWNVSCQVPLSMAFPRQEYWSGLPVPSPGDLPHPGIGRQILYH